MAFDPSDPKNPTDAPALSDASDLMQGESEPGFERVGPLIDVERFRQEYLFGVPLKSQLTGEEISDETLRQFIRKGVSDFETSVRVPVSPVRITEEFNFERADDTAFGPRQLKRWPLLEVESLQALWPGRHPGQEANYPTNWIVPDGDTGLIRIVPRSGTDVQASVNFIASSGYQGLYLGTFKHWPNMWKVTYRAGFKHDRVPDSVNDLIGILSALKLLSTLGPVLFPYNSQSIGIDGLSQGTGNAGPQFLSQRMQELTGERDRLVAQLRAFYGTDIQMIVV